MRPPHTQVEITWRDHKAAIRDPRPIEVRIGDFHANLNTMDALHLGESLLDRVNQVLNGRLAILDDPAEAAHYAG